MPETLGAGPLRRAVTQLAVDDAVEELADVDEVLEPEAVVLEEDGLDDESLLVLLDRESLR